MNYKEKQTLHEKFGNNAFAWDERNKIHGKSPTLIIPELIDGDISDVALGDDVVFEEMEDGELRSCTGLKNFIKTKVNTIDIIIFDNHNHALYFWIDAFHKGIIHTGCELIHIDEHSDLWSNTYDLDLEKSLKDEEYAWKFANLSCNVGNYIVPALNSGLIEKMVRIENEYQIDEYMNYTPPRNSILNIDLDIFATELDHIPEYKKLKIIRNLLPKVSYVTIATSPFFIDQCRAIEKLHQLFTEQ